LPKLIYDTHGLTSVKDTWEPLDHRFSKLLQFRGALIQYFQGQQPSQTLVPNWEYDYIRLSLTEFSLEGIILCKQFKR
jgi:hypothetical protein